MKNKDLIIKVARRLDKFNLDEIIVVSELQEQEVKEILSDLIKEKVIIKNNDNYFFSKKNKNINEIMYSFKSTLKPIVLQKEDGYKELLKYNINIQNKIKRYVAIINFIIHTGKENLKNVVDLFNETSGEQKVPILQL